jgi:hypothetical protein
LGCGVEGGESVTEFFIAAGRCDQPITVSSGQRCGVCCGRGGAGPLDLFGQLGGMSFGGAGNIGGEGGAGGTATGTAGSADGDDGADGGDG